MKKYFLIVSMLLSFLGGSATAQTIEESNALYKEFVRLANQGGDKAGMYDALYRCYTANYAVLKKSAKTSAAYGQALNNMRNIIPEPTLKSKACLKCLYFTKIISALCCYLEYFSYLYTIN